MFDDLPLLAQDGPAGDSSADDSTADSGSDDKVRINKTGSMSPPERPQRPPSRR